MQCPRPEERRGKSTTLAADNHGKGIQLLEIYNAQIEVEWILQDNSGCPLI